MKRLAAKFGFVHRTLWQRGQAYRWAVLLGPPPLLGCAFAALAWAVLLRAAPHPGGADAGAPWAHWTRPAVQQAQGLAEKPFSAVPPTDAAGRYLGFRPGWMGQIHALSVDAIADANVGASALSTFDIDQPVLSLSRFLDAGPPTGLFMGTAGAVFVAHTEGTYAFSVRLARSGTLAADCMVRFGFGSRRVVQNVTLNTNGQAVLDYPPVEIRLEPGLFGMVAVAGCWRGGRMGGTGNLTLLVRHPGELALRPAAADEIIRPAPPSSGG